ncbi:MAG: PAS domain-containing protein [Deltaproteobacteria bacterium]|nr:PAS domain-containing protein [Deltaproteobacteria bacterium]
MHNRKLIWRIFPANLAITLLAMLVVAWYGSAVLHRNYLEQAEAALKAQVYLIRDQVTELMAARKFEELRQYTLKAGREASVRITVVDHTGRVIADSSENPDIMDPHRDRPEIAEAFQGQTGIAVRFSKTLQENMIYVAVPLEWQGDSARDRGKIDAAMPGVLRVSGPVTAIDRTIKSIKIKIAGGAIVAVLAAILITLLVSRRISKPLEEMKQSAERFSRGDFSQRMSLDHGKSASLEVAALAAALDSMAEQLNERIRTILRQRNELEAVFSSMSEAVLAVDTEEKIINLNKAAAVLFAVEQKSVQGKLLQEVVRNVDLQHQVKQILANPEPLEDEIALRYGDDERFLQTNGVPLHDGSGKIIGVLVVLNDVTRLRRLENVRRDFVANVSHELKTPITSIKGYVETLLEGAIDDREDALHFLRIVARQSERLYAIIEDLLALSRIEKQSEDREVDLRAGELYQVLAEAVLTCKMKADEKRIHIALHCPDTLRVRMNSTLLEQAMVNLVVNAIKYSDEGSEVVVRAEEKKSGDGGRGIVISVQDFGVGIARKHLPRLFERFYRSDKARSRKVGGTGLGLAIVKHIAQAHGGDVSVQSHEGKGSTFFIHLPGGSKQ